MATLAAPLHGNLRHVYVRGEGCATCQHQGNIAMTVCAETVLLDPRLLELLRNREQRKARLLWKEQGGLSCVEVSLQKINMGKGQGRVPTHALRCVQI